MAETLGPPITRGRTAEIFASDPGWVIKLYEPEFPDHVARREFRAMQLARGLGVSCPEPRRLVEHDGRFGFEMSFIPGQHGMDRLYGGADIIEEARALARLQQGLHRLKEPELPDLRERWASRIERMPALPVTERRRLVALLMDQKEASFLLHGDFHPGNVIGWPGPPVIVDWVDAARGLPVADVARSLVLFGDGVPVDAPRLRYRSAYLAAMEEKEDLDPEQVFVWTTLAGAIRLGEFESPEMPFLRETVLRRLAAVR